MSTPASPFTVILDERDESFIFSSGRTWQSASALYAYNGTTHTATVSQVANLTSSVEIIFTGESIAIYGVTPTFSDPKTFSVLIDGLNSSNSNIYPADISYLQWYQSPVLIHGIHNITLFHITDASMDYAVVTTDIVNVSPEQTIMVDNNDSSLKYSGQNWTQSSHTFQTNHEFITGPTTPYGNTTQQTIAAGDQFTYSFDGASVVSVYGVMDWTKLGILGLAFTVDGIFDRRLNFTVASDTAQFKNGTGQQPNFMFYQTSQDFPSGNHTLLVEVAECDNQVFSFDYVTYKTLSVSAEPTAQSIESQRFRKNAIVGGIVGGLILIIFVVAVLSYYLWKKHHRRPGLP